MSNTRIEIPSDEMLRIKGLEFALNRGPSKKLRRVVEPGQAVAGAYLRLARLLTVDERAALKTAITEAFPQVLDVEIGGDVEVPDAVDGHHFELIVDSRLRIEADAIDPEIQE